MAIQVATVTLVIGQAWLKQPNGERIPIREGMTVLPGSEIITGDGSTVRLDLADSDPIYIGSDREFLFGGDVLDGTVNAADAAVSGLDAATTSILARLLGVDGELFTTLESLQLLSDGDDDAGSRQDAYASDPTERSQDNLIHLLNLLEATSSIADRVARIAEPSRPLVDEFPHTVPNDGRLSSDRFDHQGPENAGIGGLTSPSSDLGRLPDAASGTPPLFPSPVFAGISVGSITSDNILNLRESLGYVEVTGQVNGDVRSGDTVTLSIGANSYQAVVGANGTWSAQVPGSVLEQGNTLQATVTATNGDSAVTASATRTYDVDTLPPNVDIWIEHIDRVEPVGAAFFSIAAAEPRYIVSGTLNYEAGAEITVTVLVNGKEYDAFLEEGGRWSISVLASEFGYHGEVYATATATDVAGNSATASVTHDYALNTPPTATDGRIVGLEDMALVIEWDQLNVQDDSPAIDQSIIITGLPANGVLQLNTAEPGSEPVWSTIELTGGRFEVSRADIEAGRLRFMPDPHESGWDTSAGDGVGNNQADYARITYRPADGEYEGDEVTLAINIAPVADAPQMNFEVVSQSTVQMPVETSYTLGEGIVITAIDGVYSASGLGAGQLLLPPFPAHTGGNLNPGSATQGHTDIIALIGDFNTLVEGRDGQAWQTLHGIDGENRDYIFLSKPHDRYELTNATYNQGFLNGRLTDLDTGLSINLNNVKGLIYGDGHTSANIEVDYQVGGESYNEIALNLHVSLVDQDGSETLSGITLTGIPEGVTIEGALRLPSGNWYIANPDGLQSLDLALTLRVPEGTPPFAVTAHASSSEYGAASAATSSATVEAGGGSGINVSVAMAPVAGDGIINAAEAAAQTITVKGTITTDAGVSTSVILTVNGNEYTAIIDAANGTWTAEIPTSDLLADTAVRIQATAADAAGNSTTATTAYPYTVDTLAPELTVSIDTITADNVINAAEAGETVDVTGTVTGEFNAGDEVTLTVGGTVLTGTVAADGTWTVAIAGSVLAAADSLEVSVTTTDAAGNSTTTSATHAYSVDVEAPELAIAVDSITADNVINAAEADQTVDVTGTVTGEFNADDAITLTVNGVEYTGTVAADGTWTIAVAGANLAAADSLEVSVTTTDAAGNSTTTSATHAYSVDVEAPELAITVDLITADNVVNAAEAGETVDVTGTVTGEFNADDAVTLTVNGVDYTGTVAADGTWSIAVVGSDLAASSELTVSMTSTDAAGNSTTTTSTHAYGVDTEAPELTVTVDSITSDNVINAAEAGENVDVTGTVTGEFTVGDEVTLTVGSTVLTGAVAADGTWTIAVAGSDLAEANSLDVSITTTDAAGNSATVTTTHGYGVDTDAPELAIAVDSITADNVINAAEAGETVDVTGTVTGEFTAGDEVTLTVGGTVLTGTVAADGTWTIAVAGANLAAADSLEVSVTTTDAAGNSTTISTTHAYSVDVEAPELAITVDSITSDNVINAAEAGENVDVTGTVTGEFTAGDEVTLTVGGSVLTGTVAADGTWTIAVAGSDLVAADSLDVSVTTTDAAGNSTTATSTHAYGVDTEAPELAIAVDSITADNVINAAEAGETVDVTGTVTGEFTAGDEVTLTVGSTVLTGTVAADGTWTIAVAGPALAAADTLGVSVTTTDAAGNSATVTATHGYGVDTEAPDLTITVDSITADNVINAAEAGENVDVTGMVTGEFNADDAITLTVNGVEYAGTVAADGTWTIAVAGANLAAADFLDVSVTTTDAAGNSTTTSATHTYSVDVDAPELAITVDSITSDNVINAAEAGENVDVTGTVTGEFAAGDEVTLTVGDTVLTGTVAADGTWTIAVAGSDLAAADSLAVSVTTTDAAGNSTTTSATHTYSVDVEAPELAIAVDSITADNVINAAEAGETVDVTGTVTGEFSADDAVTLTVNGVEYAGKVAEDGTWTIAVAGANLAAADSLDVSITTTDAAGNSTTTSTTHAYSVDVDAPELAIAVDSITADNVINAAESGQTVDVTGTVTGEFNADDAVTLTVNGVEYVGTVAEDGTWTIAVAGSVLAAADSLDVSVTTTDAAGNSATVTTTHGYGVDTEAPELAIAVDSITSDNVINAAEAGETVDVTGTVTGEFNADDAVTLTVNGAEYTGTVAADGTWTVAVAGSDLAVADSLDVSVTTTDAAGNSTTVATTHGYGVDTDAPELTITVDSITADNVINAAEAGETVDVTGTVTGEFTAGDEVTLTVGGTVLTGTVAADGTWTIAVAGSNLAAADSLGVSVTTTDAAGNSTTVATTHAYAVDVEAPELTVTVESITADNIINAAEAGQNVDVTGTVTGEFNADDPVTLTVNGVEYLGTVAEDGTWTIAVAGSDLVAADSLDVSVTTTDAAGNSTTATSTHAYGVDTEAPELAIAVDSITADNVINAAEAGETVDVTGTVTGEFTAGDEVTLTVGSTVLTGTVAADGTWTIAVAGADLAAADSLDVSVTTTDAAGNSTTTTTTHVYGVDTEAPELTVTVDSITSDNVINAAEAGETVDVTGTVTGEFNTDDAVTLTVNGVEYAGTVAEDGTWTIAVAGANLAAADSLDVSITTTDAAGNSTTTSTTHAYSVDVEAPELAIAVDSITADNVINAAEAGENVDVTGTVTGEFTAGDEVTLTVGDTVLTGAVAADGTWTIAVAGSDLAAADSLNVSVTTTDAAGNSATTSTTHAYSVDVEAPELAITVDSITTDNVINAAEAVEMVDVTGTVTGEFTAGDEVTLTVGDTVLTGTVAADGTWTIAVAGSDLAAADSLTVTITTTDAAGNSATTSTTHVYSVDVDAPELAVAVDSITSDNVINAAEAGEMVDVTGTVTGEFNADDPVTLTVNGVEYIGTVAEDGTWTIAVAGADLAAVDSLDVSITTTDAAGNSTTTSTTHAYSVDVEAPELSITVDSITSDNVINAAEAGENVDVTGTVTGEFAAGDEVTLTVGDTVLTGTVAADGTWTIAVAGSVLAAADSLEVSVTTTDAAGNSTTTSAAHAYLVDVEAPELAIAVDSITADNVINAAEAGETVDVTGTVTGEFNTDDAVTLTVNGAEYAGTVAEDGTWTIAVAGANLAAADSLDVSVTTTDGAGNSTTTSATHTYSVDVEAPELAITVDSITADNVVNAAEAGETVDVTGTVTGEFNADDAITLTVNGAEYIGTVAEDGTWTIAVAGSDLVAADSLDVSVTTTDAAGNSTTATSTHAYGVDTEAPELAITVDSITSDNVINAAEAGENVDVTGTVTGEFNADDAITLTVNGVEYAGTVAEDGTWSIAVAGSDLAAADSLDVSVTTTDAAGNSTTTSATHAYSVDVDAPELVIAVDSITSDNVINAAEAGETVDVTGTVTGEFTAGDEVTLTVGDTVLTGTVAADGTWTIAVAGSDLATSTELSVSVTSTDAAGNSATTTSTHAYGVDTEAPELTIAVDSITPDNVINAAEAGETVDVTGTVTGEFSADDAVTLTVNGVEYAGTVAEDGTWTIAVAGANLAATTELTVSVTSTDAAGNSTTTSATHAYSVDVEAPELTITVDSITADNVINAAEAGETVDVTGTVTGEFTAGDEVTLTVGSTVLTGTVAADGTWTIAVAGSDLAAADSLDVSITTTDAAGNSTTTSTTHAYSVDVEAPELAITVDSITADNVINAAEAGETVDVTGTVTGEFTAGDEVTLTVGSTVLTGTVAADGTWTVAIAGSVLAAADSLDVSVTTTDAAGNSTTTSATHAYLVDVEAPELTVTVDSITSDNVINAAEAGASIDVTGTVTGEFNADDPVTLTVNGAEYLGTVAEDGTWTIAVAGSDLAASSELTVSVTSIDAAGNSATVTTTHGYGVDTDAPELAIAVDSITADNVINAAEAGENVDVTGTVTGEFTAGDEVTLTVGGTVLTGAVAADGTWTIAVAGANLAAADSLDVSITTTDAAGNSTTTSTTHGYGVDTEAPELTVTVDSITADNVINAAEAGASIDVTGTVTGEFNADDAITLTVNGVEYPGTVAEDGTWTIAVAGANLAAADSLDVSITTTDAAGNSTTTSTTHGYGVDTEAPELTVTVDSITADNVINAAEAGETVDVTGTVTGEFTAGDEVTLTVGSTVLTGTVAEDGTWTIAVAGADLAATSELTVSVTSTDAAGNSTTTSTTHTYTVDVVAPELAITIDPVSGDNYLDHDEAASSVAITGQVSGEVGADAVVQLMVGDHAYTATLAQDGTWSVLVAGEHLAGANSVQAIVTATDAAGNAGSSSASQSYEVQPPNEVPLAADGMVQGVEDTALVLEWSHFNVSDDSPAGDLGIVITGLPSDGELQFNAAAPGDTAVWTTIQLSDGRYEVSRADIEAGRLRFMPDAHESGWDSSAGGGVGDQQADYAQIVYRPTDGKLDGDEATLTVDIVPVADAPVVTIEVGDTSTVGGSGASYTFGDGIVLTMLDGAYTATGLNSGQLLLPPFEDKNIVPKDGTHKETDIIALVGDFDTLVSGGQPLHLINGDVGRDYVFLSKSHDQYVLSDLNTNDGRLNATVMDLATGLSVKLVNVKGLIYGDGHSSGDIQVTYQPAGDAYDLVALDVHASLVDVDGSETLSGVTLTGIPPGVTVDGADQLPNGDWYVANPEGLASLDLSLALRVPEGTEAFTVTAVATSTEHGVAATASSHAQAEIVAGAGNQVPTAEDGTVEGVEDTALVLDWSHFNVSDDSPASQQGIIITGLPADGVLQYNTAVSGSVAVWTQVTLVDGEYAVSRTDLEAGKLRFVPADDASGGDVYGGEGVGDQQADYAHIVFRPTDGTNTGAEATLRVDIAPVADAPEVHVSLARVETAVEGGGAGAGGDVVQVNGGSGVPGGFDVQDGKIVRIGDGVRVWLTEGDTVPEAANPAAQIRYYTQGNHGGDANYADIFVVHSQSGWFYRQSDWPEDQKVLYRLDSVGGNREQNADGDKDYIFVQPEDGYTYSASHNTHNNNATHVNTLDGVRVSYTGPNGSAHLIQQVSNNLEGVIYGNGATAYLADPAGTTFQTAEPSAGPEVSYDITIRAAVSDTDGSEFLGDLVLGGIPAGATVAAAGGWPAGLQLVQSGNDWILRWDDDIDAADRQTVDLVLKVSDVPEAADFTGVTVMAHAHEADGSVASSTGSAALAPDADAPVDGDTDDDGSDEDAGDGEPQDSGSGDAPADFSHTGDDLLINGDFTQYANATQWWTGNNSQGYAGWTHTGPFLDHTWMMAGSSNGGPYVGAWHDDAREITLSQQLSGVPAGSVLQLDVGWNNPNRGIPGDPYNAPKDTGNSMRLEISFGGVVYAVIATPHAGMAVGDSGFATVTAMNGAAVDIDRIETWSHDYSTSNGQNGFRPDDLSGFQTLQIQLPVDAPSDGVLALRWDPQSEGSNLTDDVMVANLHLYAGDGSVEPLASPLIDDDDDFGAQAGAGAGDDPATGDGAPEDGDGEIPQGHVLVGTEGNDVFEWSMGEDGTGHDVIQGFGTGEDGQGHDVLDLRDLLDGEQNGDLTQYLHFSTALNDEGRADTIIHVQTQGGLAPDGSGYNHQITVRDVDLVGSVTDQAELIQHLIQEGKLKVDQ